jgi:hypothetical protein
MMRTNRLLPALAVVVLAACGGSDSTGPNNTSVAGSWDVSMNVSDPTYPGTTPLNCQISGIVLTLSESSAGESTHLKGNFSGGTRICTLVGGLSISEVMPGFVLDGDVSFGNRVYLVLLVCSECSPDFRERYSVFGTVTGNTISAAVSSPTGVTGILTATKR